MPMRHHTKDKGDIGVSQVIADLVRNGIGVSIPLSEHSPFDLIAISANGKLAKIQVKYATAKKGIIAVNLRHSYSDRRGVHTTTANQTHIDAYAVYCPNNNQVYYVRKREIKHARNTLTLRIDTPKNNQVSGVRFASQFEDASRLFK